MMSSLEALWIIKFGDYETPDQLRNGGVLIFETGRLFGGDSGYAYIGNYKANDATITATARIVRFDPEMESVFGDVGDITIEGQLTPNGDTLVGKIWPVDNPSAGVAIHMLRFAELP